MPTFLKKSEVKNLTIWTLGIWILGIVAGILFLYMIWRGLGALR